MKVIFWGTRGSLPASMTASMVRKKVKKVLETVVKHGPPPKEEAIEAWIDWALPFSVWGAYGTNTPCVEIVPGDTPDTYVICDAGSGLRDCGNHILATRGPAKPATYHIFQSHLHWDHIQGFPFFPPAYIPGNTIVFHGCHAAMENSLMAQHHEPHFPVDWSMLGADIRFDIMQPDTDYHVAGLTVRAMRQTHPGASYGFRFEKDGQRVIYSTDNEHKFEFLDPSYPFLEFCAGADLLIFDAQYTLKEATTTKEDWGHSNNLVAAEMAQETGVKHLCLFHQEPAADDETLQRFLEETAHYASLVSDDSPMKISMAYDGLVIDLGT
ncbi:MAG: MBL fold metallo-hydrolase [Desulfovibrionaceae bacterium]